MMPPDRHNPLPANAAASLSTTSLPGAMVEPDAAPAFLDPHGLIESSRPRPTRWAGLPLLAMGIVSILVFTAPSDSPVGSAIQTIAPVLFLAGVVSLNLVARRGASILASEAQAVVALDELVQLRRWPEAADLSMRLFTRPMMSAERRMHALTALASILTRYHRFDDARVVHDYLLQRLDRSPATADGLTPARGPTDPTPDPSTAHAIRVARAMGLLREDRLVDADRAMSELRREVSLARDEVRRAAGPEAAAKVRSAGLVLLDLYRDVKTRHYEEATIGFERSIESLREQLGGRVADAWLLYAAALQGLGRDGEAKVAYLNATALIPAVELHRRYPETAVLETAFRPWKWPE